MALFGHMNNNVPQTCRMRAAMTVLHAAAEVAHREPQEEKTVSDLLRHARSMSTEHSISQHYYEVTSVVRVLHASVTLHEKMEQYRETLVNQYRTAGIPSITRLSTYSPEETNAYTPLSGHSRGMYPPVSNLVRALLAQLDTEQVLSVLQDEGTSKKVLEDLCIEIPKTVGKLYELESSWFSGQHKSVLYSALSRLVHAHQLHPVETMMVTDYLYSPFTTQAEELVTALSGETLALGVRTMMWMLLSGRQREFNMEELISTLKGSEVDAHTPVSLIASMVAVCPTDAVEYFNPMGKNSYVSELYTDVHQFRMWTSSSSLDAGLLRLA